MAGIAADNDPFYMTFGKENWNQTNQSNSKATIKQITIQKKPKLMFEYDINTQRPRRSSQTHKKKTSPFSSLHKQNTQHTERTLRRTKAMSSLTDRHPKQLMDVATIRQELEKKYSNDKQIKQGRKSRSMFDNELNKRLKEIETAAKAKISRIRNLNECRKLESPYEVEIVLDKYKLINSEAGKRARLTTVNPTINRYRQEMIKLDSLIQRVNAKIGSSTPSQTVELVKQYALKKA